MTARKDRNESQESTDAGVADSSWEVESLFHFIVNASHFEKSLDFYTTLGFRVLRDNRDIIWPPEVAENFGMPVAQGRGALLALGEGELHTRIDLIEWLEPRWEDAAASLPPESRVPRVIALRTRNVRAAYRDLKARGIEFIREPREANPSLGVESVACCLDPDGLVVELIEYMPGRLGSRIDDLPSRLS
ncbi:VOC family protein [Myxococcota bacterium]|nr:VOC family protein [Myxococcota bacterium]